MMCDPILENLLKMQPHYSQSNRNIPISLYKEVAPSPPPHRVFQANSFRTAESITRSETILKEKQFTLRQP